MLRVFVVEVYRIMGWGGQSLLQSQCLAKHYSFFNCPIALGRDDHAQ